ncbi:hypothetical protein V8C34DRAFT_270887 [Trichoderma compactum]
MRRTGHVMIHLISSSTWLLSGLQFVLGISLPRTKHMRYMGGLPPIWIASAPSITSILIILGNRGTNR